MEVDQSSDGGSWHHVEPPPPPAAADHPGVAEHTGGAAASSRVTPEQAAAEMSRLTSATSIAETTGRIIDLKTLCKPEMFTGEEKKWHEWRFRMDKLFQLIGITDAATFATTAADMDL